MAGTIALSKLFELLEAMEDVQRQKVIDLARRLLPYLTAEDIRNPHDFPDLDDPDWHYEDGQLCGIQAVLSALRALAHEDASNDNESENPKAAKEPR